MTPDMLVWSLRMTALEDAVRTGIRALIEAYYRNYTDATELEPEFTGPLQRLLDQIFLPDCPELAELVVEAEREINAAGGIKSDSDGMRHAVRTDWCWEEAAANG